MHKTEGAGNELGWFDDGGPGNEPTTVEQNWLNAVQGEVINVIEGMGLTLKTAATETKDQLIKALKIFSRKYPVVYAATGFGGSFAITADPTVTGYTAGDKYLFEANHTPAVGATYTLNVDSQGAIPLKDRAGNTLYNGQIIDGQIVEAVYDGTVFLANVGGEQDLAMMDGMAQAWFRFRPGTTDLGWRCTFAALAGTGEYRVTFDNPPSGWWYDSANLLMLWHVDHDGSGQDWYIRILSRGASYFDIKAYKDNVATNIPSGTHLDLMFFGKVTPA